MRTIGNILWFIFIGLWEAIGYFFAGLIWCITIIGIPFGLQAFKFAKLVIAPFGKTVDSKFDAHPIANIIWAVFGGFVLALGFLFVGIILCITIIGIPVGKQAFKFAKLSIMPFGAEVH
ncbi:MAG: YccF domain-containing protein [Bacilli bacterium]|nr:YccF domain-containing protein [Bacilli bacterium]